jgi:hypothetical protein
MTMFRARATALCLLLAGTGRAPALAAQVGWGLSADLGMSFFSGTAVDSAGRSFYPDGRTTLSLRLDRRFGAGRAGLGLALLYAPGGVALTSGDVTAIQGNVMDLYGIAPELSWRLGATARGSSIAAHAGPVLEVWSLSDGGDRTRVGAHGAVSLAWPISDRLAGAVRAGVTLTASPFDAAELPAGFAPRALWRRAVSLALRYRL